jgi:hypothetical protein
MSETNGNGNGNGSHPKIGTDIVKCGLAQMLKGGVIVSIVVIMFQSASFFFCFLSTVRKHRNALIFFAYLSLLTQ